MDQSPVPYGSGLGEKTDSALAALMNSSTTITTTTDDGHKHMSKAELARTKKDQKEQSRRNISKIATQERKIESMDEVSAFDTLPRVSELLRLVGLHEGGHIPRNEIIASTLCYLDRCSDTLKAMREINNINKRLSLSRKKIRMCERGFVKQQASQALKKTQKRLAEQKRAKDARDAARDAGRSKYVQNTDSEAESEESEVSEMEEEEGDCM